MLGVWWGLCGPARAAAERAAWRGERVARARGRMGTRDARDMWSVCVRRSGVAVRRVRWCQAAVPVGIVAAARRVCGTPPAASVADARAVAPRVIASRLVGADGCGGGAQASKWDVYVCL